MHGDKSGKWAWGNNESVPGTENNMCNSTKPFKKTDCQKFVSDGTKGNGEGCMGGKGVRVAVEVEDRDGEISKIQILVGIVRNLSIILRVMEFCFKILFLNYLYTQHEA